MPKKETASAKEKELSDKDKNKIIADCHAEFNKNVETIAKLRDANTELSRKIKGLRSGTAQAPLSACQAQLAAIIKSKAMPSRKKSKPTPVAIASK